jgi:hypothetical protein
MPYRIAGIDVHKKMLAVVVADVDVAGEWCFERRQCGTSPSQLQALAAWLTERDVEEVVMESTALEHFRFSCSKAVAAMPDVVRALVGHEEREGGSHQLAHVIERARTRRA